MTAESVVECDYRHSMIAGYKVARGTGQPDPHRVCLRRLARQPPKPAVQIETRPMRPPRQGRQRDVLTQPGVDDDEELEQLAGSRRHDRTVPIKRHHRLTVLALSRCPTDAGTNWTTVGWPDGGATGSRDLYLRFTGGSGHVFNLDWRGFAGVSMR
nr:hypothetical protein [Actinoplanes rectilineatus]